MRICWSQCPNSSLPSLSPGNNVCFLSLWLLFCKKFICTFFVYFRFHILVISYDICLFLTSLIWKYLGLSVLLKMALFWSFYVWVIFHCIYVPYLLYPLLCWWTFRLLPCLRYCNWYSYEHLGVFIFWTMVFSKYMSRSGISGSYGSYVFSFLKDPKYCFP